MSYVIDLKAKHTEIESFDFQIDDDFFKAIEGSLIKGGCLRVHVVLRSKNEGRYQVELSASGHVTVPCDRCLADLTLPVEASYCCDVKFGPEADVDEGLIVLAEHETTLDLTSTLYDTIALALPIHPVHAEGECDAEMTQRLSGYMVARSDDDE